MNFRSIRVRYSSAFIAIGLAMAIVGLVSVNLISSLKESNFTSSSQFNPAISAVLNADRDLYQARTAELNVLIDPSSLKDNQASYEENAQQAFDRMYVLIDLMATYPEVTASLAEFDAAFNKWKSASAEVFVLVAAGKIDEAKKASTGSSGATFSTLRDFYDVAGEAADNTGAQLSEETVTQVARQSFILNSFLVFVVLLALVVGFLAPRAMSNAIVQLSGELESINSGGGDLSRRIHTKRSDEIGAVAAEFDRFLDGLGELISGIVTKSSDVLGTVGDMQESATTVQAMSNEQLESIDVIVTAVNEMSVAIKEVAGNAQNTAGDISEVNSLSVEGKAIVGKAVDQIRHVADTVGNASHVISELATSSNNIASVLDVIRGIAEQTNLLALNAAIEAARAGEQGRGFAVVADEVRSLASKTQQSTDDIQTMIESLQKGVSNAVIAIEEGLESVNSSVESSESTLAALDSIATAASRVSDAAMLIATSTEEQSQVAEDVNQHLVRLSDMGRTSLDNSSANKDRSNKVKDVTSELHQSVNRFKLS